MPVQLAKYIRIWVARDLQGLTCINLTELAVIKAAYTAAQLYGKNYVHQGATYWKNVCNCAIRHNGFLVSLFGFGDIKYSEVVL